MKSVLGVVAAIVILSSVATAQTTQQQADAAKSAAEYWQWQISGRRDSATALENTAFQEWEYAVEAYEECDDYYWLVMGSYQLSDGNIFSVAGDEAFNDAISCDGNGADSKWLGGEAYDKGDWESAKDYYSDAAFWYMSAVFKFNESGDYYLEAEAHYILALTLFDYGAY